jgi:hypothetical protein
MPPGDHRARIVAAPEADLGRTDPTRRWALSGPEGELRFPGVTRPEAAEALPGLDAASGPWSDLLLVVRLPVLLSDGAGPHLIDHAGRLVLPVADHPRLSGARVAMGPCEEEEQIGIVAPEAAASGVWRWIGRAQVASADRLRTLEEIDALADARDLRRWAPAGGV